MNRRYTFDSNGVIVFLDKPTSDEPPKAGIPDKRMVKCPHCRSHVLIRRLVSHLAKAHGIFRNAPNPAPKPRKPQDSLKHAGEKTRDAERQKPQPHREFVTGQDHRDGSKYLGHAARENGKFGSIPQYDDYGDESSPE